MTTTRTSSSSAPSRRLSKSRYLAGLQCPRLLWWKTHEPDAPELVPGPAQQAIFDRGHEIGELALRCFPGGVLIERDRDDLQASLDATRAAMASGAPAVFEAAFQAEGIYVAVDVLERTRGGWGLVEVKSATRLKEVHVPDVAVQLHVLRRCGVPVTRSRLMVLNRECRCPDLSNLFRFEDLGEWVEPALEEVASRSRAMLRVLDGPLPEAEIGERCFAPYSCPFQARCWAEEPDHHITTLYRGGAKAWALFRQGVRSVTRLGPYHALSEVQDRQVRAVRERRMIVVPGLSRALAAFEGPLGYLDFETLNPAVPRWPGCRPYDAVPAQFVYCERGRDGRIEVREWLADGGRDPREEFALRLLEACAGAQTILAWNAGFERGCIDRLADRFPKLAPRLRELRERIDDLLPVVRGHVYHPDFHGSFSLKSVLPALVDDLGYDGLPIRDGEAAARALELLVRAPERLSSEERAAMRDALSAYCRVDTLALLKLHDRLRELADEER